MKKFIAAVLITTICSCGDSSKNNKAENAATSEDFEIGIDTAAITNRESLLEAARTLKAVKEKEELNKESSTYKKHYYKLVKYKGILSKKMATITDTMPASERVAFIKLYREILP